MTTPVRGQVYWADVGFGRKPWLVVSNNQRNRHTQDCLVLRITTTRSDLPTWVELRSGEPVVGSANADNIETLGRDELGDYAGALSPGTMTRVDEALGVALGLDVQR